MTVALVLHFSYRKNALTAVPRHTLGNKSQNMSHSRQDLPDGRGDGDMQNLKSTGTCWLKAVTGYVLLVDHIIVVVA